MPLVLVTGLPHSGKTTCVQAVVRAVTAALADTPDLAGRSIGGFVTEEVREAGVPADKHAKRIGFDVIGLRGESRTPLARPVAPRARGPRVGKWGVHVEAFTKVAAELLGGDPDLVVMDEIGKMELFSNQFVKRASELCRAATADHCFALVTVASTGGGFIGEVKRLPGSQLIEVTPETRDVLPATIAAQVLTWWTSGGGGGGGGREVKDGLEAAAAAPAAPLGGKNGGESKTVQASLCIIPDPELWKDIQKIRRKHDKHIVRWPPHINLLYPFVPIEHFDEAADKLAAALSSVKPFEIRLDDLGVFSHSKKSHTFWLDPQAVRPRGGGDSQCPLEGLYECLLDVFPHCDDTNTKSPEGFRPHLSLGQAKGQPPNLPALASLWPGGRFTVSHLHMIYRSNFHDPFHVRRAVALGAGPVGAGVAVDWMYTADGEAYWQEAETAIASNELPLAIAPLSPAIDGEDGKAAPALSQ